MAPKTTTNDGTTVTDPTTLSPLALAFSDLVRIERKNDASALVRLRNYGEIARRVEAAIADARAAHEAAVATARTARKGKRGAARDAIVMPVRPAEIMGTVRDVYARHGANYALACKAVTRIEGTIARCWGDAPPTIGLAGIDLVYECTQRLRANLRKLGGIDSTEIEVQAYDHAQRIIADVASGLSIATVRRRHKQRALVTSRYAWAWETPPGHVSGPCVREWVSVDMTTAGARDRVLGLAAVEHVDTETPSVPYSDTSTTKPTKNAPPPFLDDDESDDENFLALWDENFRPLQTPEAIAWRAGNGIEEPASTTSDEPASTTSDEPALTSTTKPARRFTTREVNEADLDAILLGLSDDNDARIAQA